MHTGCIHQRYTSVGSKSGDQSHKPTSWGVQSHGESLGSMFFSTRVDTMTNHFLPLHKKRPTAQPVCGHLSTSEGGKWPRKCMCFVRAANLWGNTEIEIIR